MQFRSEILTELNRTADSALRDHAVALFGEVTDAFGQGGADAVVRLLHEKQSAIQDEFNENLDKLEKTI